MSHIGEARFYRRQMQDIRERLSNQALDPAERVRLQQVLQDYARDYDVAWGAARPFEGEASAEVCT